MAVSVQVVAPVMACRPNATGVVMKEDAAAFVGRLQRGRRRLIPREIAEDAVQAALLIKVVVAPDENLAAVDLMEQVADALSITGDGEITYDVEQIIFRDARVDRADDGGVHLLDTVERARGRAMTEDSVMSEVQVCDVELLRE